MTTREHQTKETVVLVGTYKGDHLTKWHGWYNYPVGNEECKIENGELSKVNELWLFKGTKDERRYKAEFIGGRI